MRKMGYENKLKRVPDNKLHIAGSLVQHFSYETPQYHDDPVRWRCWCSSTKSVYSLDKRSLDDFVDWISEHASCPLPIDEGTRE